MGLKINEEKSKYMEMGNRTEPMENKEYFKVKIDENKELKFEKIKNFVYLGVVITYNYDSAKEIEARIAKGNKCTGGLLHVLRAKQLSLKTKIRIYQTVIRPSVTYACETWIMNKREQEKLERWERKVLRKIYGGRKEGEEWRRRTNEEVMNMYGDPSIVQVAKAQRIRWLGHIQRLPNERTTKIMLRASPIGSKRRGRPRKKWMDAVEEDIKKLGIVNWTEIAKDKKKWRGIVHQALGLNGL